MIETSRARLRHFIPSDYDFLRSLDTDPDIMKFTPAKVVQTPEQTRARLERYSQNPGVWAALDKQTDDFIGWFMLISTDLEFPEIGFMLVKKFWGQGLASEISNAIIEKAFDQEGHAGICARTTLDNFASMQVLKKLGFALSSQNTEVNFFVLKNPTASQS